ncbi:hypothetical protein ABUW04_02085 [Streptacidiphilus sp. N1-10]|uniref:Uncharacterized protein n=1 Tax=Streptacidiphilus jeojiensis TaxID=3229225 RepID=A0ABV6XGC2_9ACTN
MGDPRELLDAALARLTALIEVEPTTAVDGCTHCLAAHELAALSGPAEAVPDDLVAYVAGDIPSMWGDFSTLYRRLTPRILTLLMRGELHVDESLVGLNLARADWRSWPNGQALALEAVFTAWWSTVLASPAACPTVDQVLDLLLSATGTITPWLERWAATRTPSADLHLEDLIQNWAPYLVTGQLLLGFHDDFDVTAEVTAWMLQQGPERVQDEDAWEWLTALDGAARPRS